MIYLTEDDDNIRKLVSYALKKEGYEVREFSSSEKFWHEISIELPSLIILDIMLPGEDGLTILEKLKTSAVTEDIPVIMLTARGSEFDKVTGLDMGADDYISKPFGITELVSRIKAVMRRYHKSSKTEKNDYRAGGLYVNPAKHVIEVDGKPVDLSYKEFRLLMMLLEANGNVVDRNELLGKIWGQHYDESRTLDVHIRKLRIKLGDDGSIIRTVKNIGYKIGGADIE